MKNLIIILMLCSSFITNAQITNSETKADALEEEQYSNAYRQKIRDSHIHSAKIYKYKSTEEEKAGKGYLADEIVCDNQGNMNEYTVLNKHGNIKSHYTYKHDEQNRFIEYAQLKSNGEMKYKITYTFDAAGNSTDEREFVKRPDYVYWHSISSYDEKQNITELKFLTKNDTKAGMKYLYSYYPDGSKKQTIEYNRRGKATHTWNYDCNPVGTLVAKNLKDTSKICIRYETDKDGNQIKIKEEHVKQGKVVRIVSKFNMSGSLMDIVGYDVKGRSLYHTVSLYDEKNNMTEFTEYKGLKSALKEHSVFHYDTHGNMTELIAYKKAPVPDHVYKYNYTLEQ